MDNMENSSSAAGTALTRARSRRINSRRNTFQAAYELTMEARKISQVDPRDEDLWPYFIQCSIYSPERGSNDDHWYFIAAYAIAHERTIRTRGRMPRNVRGERVVLSANEPILIVLAILAARLIKQLNAKTAFRLPSRPPEPSKW